MIQKLKHISSVVLLLFFGASMLQSMSPLVMTKMSNHNGEVMSCSMDGDCDGASCSIDGTKSCSCNHAASSKSDSDNTTLCGCNHHGNEPIGTNAPFQIKAPLVSTFQPITFSPSTVLLNTSRHHLFIFTDDIFHPPRPRA